MADGAALLVLIGTKAQFIKTAPILRELDRRGVQYRLVYTGQHSETFDALERMFGTRAPDENLVPGVEAATRSGFAAWTASFWRHGVSRVRRPEWRTARIALVHGDTASTLYGALLGRMAGARVAHVEAGLRSPHLTDPFPEELIRRAVSRVATIHLAPDDRAVAHLRGRRGRVAATHGNTLRDALAMALDSIDALPAHGGGGGYAIASIHRTENLSDGDRLDALMRHVVAASERVPIRFVLHPVTRAKLAVTGWATRLQRAPGVELLERTDYREFVKLMLGAQFLMTDGGSNQEEAAMLGMPTLLLRRTTERHDGLDGGVVLSELKEDVIRSFVVAHAGRLWKVREVDGESPSARIVDVLLEELGR